MFKKSYAALLRSQSLPWASSKSLAVLSQKSHGHIWQNFLSEIDLAETRMDALQKDMKDKSLSDLIDIIRADIQDQSNVIDSLSRDVRKLVILEMEKKTKIFEQDFCDARIEVKAGVGGEEAFKWAQEVFHMYLNVAGNIGWHISEESASGELMKCVVKRGPSADYAPYRLLRFESGVHRVQRIPFNSDRMQTSAAAVYVIPKVDVPRVKIRESDLKVFVSKKSSGAGGQSVNSAYQQVRMTHVPSGFTVVVNESHAQQENREMALEKIQNRVQQMEEEKVLAAMAHCRKGQVKTADRSEKVRSYNFQRNEVNDHRLSGSVVKESVDSFMTNGSSLVSLWTALKEQRDTELINEYLTSL